VSVNTGVHAGVLVVELDNPPVNALGPTVLSAFDAAIRAGNADANVLAFVISGANGTFSGGADIRTFGTPWPPDVPDLRAVIAAIEASPKPFVAALDGVAFGGGLEVALACDARYATPRARLALPEINLGLLPGAGGTQRLPRAIGVEAALDMIVGGAPIDAARAQALGLVEVVAGDAVAAACTLARSAAAGPRRHMSALSIGGDAAERIAAARARQPSQERGGLAARHCIDCIEAAAMRTFDEGLALERRLFEELRASEQSRSRIHVFFAEREAQKVPELARDTQASAIATACVIGAGTMGGGIAMALANGGIDVTVIDTSAAALERCRATIAGNYAATVRKGQLTEAQSQTRQERIAYDTNLEHAAATADAIVEAVFEELAIKRDVFATLDRVCKPGALLATNTSTLDIDAIAAATARPQDVIGLHFFSPANVMRLLEIVRGGATSATALATSLALAKRIAKVGVVARTCDGFIGNRMLAGYGREAYYLLEEGALPQDVDRVMQGFGFAMGPLAVGDLAGLDVGWRIRKRRQAEGRFTALRDPEIADRLCERGRFGQKTGAGVYRYGTGSRTPQPDPEVEDLIRGESVRLGIARRTVTDDEILLRCLLPLVNEGAKILADGTAIRAGDIDLVWIYGYGFPAFRGGPMHWADATGLARVVDELQTLEARHGSHWHPAPLLVELAAANRQLTDLAPYAAREEKV